MRKIQLTFALLTVMSAGASAQTIGLVQVSPSCTTTFPTCSISATAAGHLIVVGIQIGGGVSTGITISSVTDNVGNTYAEAGAARSIDTAAGSVVDIWYAKNSAAGATTLTITPSTTVTNAGVLIWEFSGADTSSPLDQTAVLNSQASSATPSGASVTTAQTGELVMSLLAVAGNVTGIASGNAFVSDSGLKGNGWAHLITTTAGTFAAQWNQSPAGTFASSTASFKAAASGGGGALNACDLNSDGKNNVVDVQLGTNMYLGLLPCTANIAGPGVCSPLVVTQLTNAALTGVCTTANSHTVTLNWTASTTPSVTYRVYRATASGAYTTPLATSLSATTYVDSTALAGQTYYYVTTAVDSNNNESSHSNEATAVVPFP
jgi:hypothetical protein